jgi:glycerol-3-phosphate acyltransferase PlsY
MKIAVFIFLSYLLGSISGSLLLGRFKNIDIRTLGSGNAGGTNALRTVGPAFALGTIVIDILKGFIPVYFFVLFINYSIPLSQVLFGIAAVAGHVFPIFYGFKGGKGAGTLIGVVLAIFPYSILFIFSVWLLTLIFTGYVGLSTMFAGVTLVIITATSYPQSLLSEFGYFTLGVSVFLFYTHRMNIQRMMKGTENQFKKIMIFKK